MLTGIYSNWVDTCFGLDLNALYSIVEQQYSL